MSIRPPALVVLHEHPEWQKPLFAALEQRGVRFEAFDQRQFEPAAVGAAAFGFDPFERVVDYLAGQFSQR